MKTGTIITQEGERFEVVGIRRPEEGEYFYASYGDVLVAGEDEISEEVILKPLKWKPEKGEKYFIPFLYNNSDQSNGDYTRLTWTDSAMDNRYYSTGFVCKTPVDALSLLSSLVEETKQQREKDWRVL